MKILVLVAACFGPDLSDQWLAGLPAYQNRNPMLSPSVELQGDAIVLRNRGILVSRDEFSSATVSFKWKWTKGEETGKYQDQLCVVFATDGRQRSWASEIKDGLVVRMNPVTGNVSIEHFLADAQEATQLALVDGYTFIRGTDYDVRITHDNNRMTFKIANQHGFSVRLPDQIKGKKIAIYNRESVAGIPKESVLINLKVE